MDIVEELRNIYATKGLTTFEGDRICSQTAHGLQTARNAENDGASAAMIKAALLHDIGRIINPRDRELTDQGTDAKHEIVAQEYLEQWFGPEVTTPIRWHVAAKRYLVVTDPTYRRKLSDGSTRSMTGQGGVLSEAEIEAFLAQPFAREGVTLRRWDDQAKFPDAKTPDFDHYVSHIEACLKN